MSFTRACDFLIASKDGKRAIYVDSLNRQEIIAYIQRDSRHKKKFKFITDIILGGLRNTSIYDKEEINNNIRGVTAMKFFKGQENDRIYCKEITTASGSFIVIAAVLYEKKKTKGLNKQQKSIINVVNNYFYEPE